MLFAGRVCVRLSVCLSVRPDILCSTGPVLSFASKCEPIRCRMRVLPCAAAGVDGRQGAEGLDSSTEEVLRRRTGEEEGLGSAFAGGLLVPALFQSVCAWHAVTVCGVLCASLTLPTRHAVSCAPADPRRHSGGCGRQEAGGAQDQEVIEALRSAGDVSGRRQVAVEVLAQLRSSEGSCPLCRSVKYPQTTRQHNSCQRSGTGPTPTQKRLRKQYQTLSYPQNDKTSKLLPNLEAF